MIRNSLILAFALALISTNTHAGFYSSNYNSSGTAVASIDLEGKGLYNLVVSVQFLNKPADKREFETDGYEELINRLSVEWKGVALKTVLTKNVLNIAGLQALRSEVESAIQGLIKSSKTKHGVAAKTEVVFSINNFYLLEPHN